MKKIFLTLAITLSCASPIFAERSCETPAKRFSYEDSSTAIELDNRRLVCWKTVLNEGESCGDETSFYGDNIDDVMKGDFDCYEQVESVDQKKLTRPLCFACLWDSH
jgi:hypothetical protein